MNSKHKPVILVINPGSTSTKVALFTGKEQTAIENIKHDDKELVRFNSLWSQFDFRISAIEDFLEDYDIINDSIDAVVGRGGILKPLKRGTYLVNDEMIRDARAGVRGSHVSNLGCALADHIAKKFKCNAYTVDPVSVDEFEPVARFSGHPLIERRSLSHSLNLRAATFWAAEKLGIDAQKNNFIVAHLGSGISIAPIKNSRVIDVNDASSAGPFSPERTGALPLLPLIDLCFSGKYSNSDIKEMVMSRGGLKAYLGTKDMQEIEKRIENNDENAKSVFIAMCYQIAKEIGAMATVLNGDVKAIVLTGGLAKSHMLITEVTGRIMFIAPVFVFPGELEMEAMAQGVLRVLTGKEELRNY